ncbi:hypothetical protein FAUST_4296 [Fusarium austroamericanum]|uniref:DNA mismatch repair protein S5 domain-containing protein n=1 Tax=Fusarium austroamericanum TaxID=282268 RepID=A0AAN6C391_FUSAU|nr:hypothetical protein FAUST_4296 [Fusarium austroamericanum]
MSISQLPPSSAHRLRSSHQLPDPLSVIKELVDNSIDSGATSIEITIAPNTVDKIQVRDNGSGIQIEDFQFLGCRSHTSKIRNYDELHQNGGKTLGFRGEALASATETAAIKITTRTAQDPIASLLMLKAKTGGISKKQPVSGTIGTTVQATNLFDKFTVRKQNAIKTSRRSLVEIQRLLESYAIAIPHLKISFKVSSPSTQSWSYSPCPPSNTQEAITQIFGHTLAAQLVEVSSDSNVECGSTGVQLGTLRITALLPRPGSDVQVIKGKGAFISVDSRPISSTRSTGKKLVSVFKSSISKIFGSPDSSRAPANPFLQISIQCPPGSYDPNVSQLKDEVMFDNEPAVISCFQALCDAIYVKKVPGSKGMQNKTMPAENTPTPTAGALKAPKANGGEGRFQNRNGHESLSSDHDLIEPLNDEFERLLVGNSGAFRNNESTIPSVFTHSPSPSKTRQQINNVISDTNQSEKIQQMMRTKLCINLSRRDSDSTDIDGTDGLVPVQVTPRRAASPPKEQLYSHSRLRTMTLGRRSEDIGSYFRPVRDKPIVIATDETATPENTQLGDSLASPCETNRRPLKELTQSEVNTFQEDEEEDFSDGESLIELPPTEPALGPSPRTSPRRMAPPRMPNSPFRPLTRPQQSSSLDTGLELLPNLQTPPPSDPRRVDNSTRRDSRRNSANVFTRGQRPSQSSMVPSPNRTGDQGPRQSRIHVGSGPTASYNRRRSEQIGRGNGLAGRRNAPTSRDSSDAHLKDWLHNIHANSEDQEAYSHPRLSIEESQGQIPLDKASEQQNDIHWSHSIQALLMRTPPPRGERSGNETQNEHYQVLDHSQDLCNGDINPRPAKRQRHDSSITTPTDEEPDPRQLLIKRQRIHTGGGQLKRIASKKLPLETIPQADLTVNLSANASIQMSALVNAALEFMRSGRAAEQDSAIRFDNMAEVDKVDELLRHATESWLSGDSSIEVEYMLRSGAKGKSKA